MTTLHTMSRKRTDVLWPPHKNRFKKLILLKKNTVYLWLQNYI